MTTVPASPIVNLPFMYVNNLQVSNNATTPNTKVDVAVGQCRDSTNTYDMTLSTAVTINAANTGLNGIDTGTFAASKVYYVHLVSDPVSYNTTGAIISLSLTSPTLPSGYAAFRCIGAMVTDGSTHFYAGYWSGNNNRRLFVYDSPVATSVTAGTSATYAAIDLTTLVPAVNQSEVTFRANWTANAAADTFNMQGANSTGDAWSLIAPVAGGTAHTIGFGTVLAQLVSGAPKVNYKVSAVGGVAINVASYVMNL